MDSNTPAPDPKRCPPVPSIPPAPGDTGFAARFANNAVTLAKIVPWARDAMAPHPSVDDDFDAFWLAYGGPGLKDVARGEYRHLIACGVSHWTLLEAAMKYERAVPSRFRLSADIWLVGKGWESDLPVQVVEMSAGRMPLSATPPLWRPLIVALAISIPVLVVGIGVLCAAMVAVAAMDGVMAP